jgi:hypothetical protein
MMYVRARPHCAKCGPEQMQQAPYPEAFSLNRQIAPTPTTMVAAMRASLRNHVPSAEATGRAAPRLGI